MSKHTTAGGYDIIFVDSRIQNPGALLLGVADDAEVVYLDGRFDGLTQIADYLSLRPGAAAAHLLAHGAAGRLWLGDSMLDNATLAGRAPDLARIGAGLASDGDLLVYACDLAAGDAGAAFVARLAALTGADVAASDGRTGAGGDWALEVGTGPIEAGRALAAYSHDLAIPASPVTMSLPSSLSFAAKTDHGAGQSPAAVISADVDGDGDDEKVDYATRRQPPRQRQSHSSSRKTGDTLKSHQHDQTHKRRRIQHHFRGQPGARPRRPLARRGRRHRVGIPG